MKIRKDQAARIDALCAKMDAGGPFKKGQDVVMKGSGKIGTVIESDEDFTLVDWRNGSESRVKTAKLDPFKSSHARSDASTDDLRRLIADLNRKQEKIQRASIGAGADRPKFEAQMRDVGSRLEAAYRALAEKKKNRIDAVVARVDASKELDNLREELAETRKKLERAIRGRDKEEIDELREMIAELQKKIARTDSKGK